MMDIEDRVRQTLHGMAADLPPTEGARADFERRLAGRRRGRSTGLVIAAAAAVVVAGVAIPVALNGDAGQRVGQTTTPPPPPSASSPTSGDGTPNAPVVITTITDGGVEKTVVFWVTDGAERQMCLELRPVDEDDPATPPGPDCDPVPATWPVRLGAGPGTNVLTGGVLSGYIEETGPEPLRNWLRFTTAPGVARLEVRAGDSSPVPLTGGIRLHDGATVHFANFGAATPWGFGYTAYDDKGNVVENAIT